MLFIHLDWSGQAPRLGHPERMIATLEPQSFILLRHFSNPNLCAFTEIPPVPYSSFIQPCLYSLMLQWEVLITPCLQGCDPSHQLPRPLHHHTGCQCLPLQRMLPFVWTGAPHERLQVNIFVSLHVTRRYRSRDSSELQRGHGRLLA